MEQIITRPTQVADQTATLIDHIVTNSPDKVSQSNVIGLGLSNHDLIYRTRRTSLPNSHKHNVVFVRSLERYSPEKFLEILRDIVAPNYPIYTCVNDVYSDFIYRFVEAINSRAPSRKITVKANSKPLFDNHIISAIQRRDKLYKKFKHYCLETDKVKCTRRKRYWRKRNITLKED